MARRGRDDPYRGFNFNMLFGTVTAAIAGFAIVKKLVRRRSAERLYPGVYVSEEPTGSRPIEGVGTTVASGRAGPEGKGRSGSRRSAATSGSRRTRAAKPKRR